MLNHNDIPEISIKTYKFTLFEKEVFLVLRNDQIESINIFFSLLNNKVNIEDAKKAFVEDYIKRSSQDRLVNLTLDYNFIIKNFLGLEDVMNKVEDFYKVILRDSKIDEITNE